jgi:hypothetical protein
MKDYEPTIKQEQAIREYLHEAVIPLIEDVLVKKLGQAMSFCSKELKSAEAEKQKPVLWAENLTDPQPHAVTDLKYCSVAQHESGEDLKYIPLYTTPQIKKLSDEEIKAIANNLTCTPDKNWNVLFAKAILKKASEK